MDSIKKLLIDESGSAEAASVAVMIGLLSSGLSGYWNAVISDPRLIILGLVGVVFLFWLVLKR